MPLPLPPPLPPADGLPPLRPAWPAGKVVFPSQYPYKPPSILMLTPNGRFATNTKLCLRCGAGWCGLVWGRGGALS